jgi:hypothetical protein
MAETYTGEVIRIALLAGDEGAIRDKEFADCDIHGPAVLFLDEGTVMNACQLDGPFDAVVLELSPGRTRLMGVVHVQRTSFIGCRFHNVGIAAMPAQISIIKSGFGM